MKTINLILFTALKMFSCIVIYVHVKIYRIAQLCTMGHTQFSFSTLKPTIHEKKTLGQCFIHLNSILVITELCLGFNQLHSTDNWISGQGKNGNTLIINENNSFIKICVSSMDGVFNMTTYTDT